MSQADLAPVLERLAGGGPLVVLSGAGLSAASGVPTFRGAGGLWRRHRAEDLATPQAFARDPELVWAWYDERRTTVAGCAPNPAHEVLARWSRERAAVTVVTQNVDGLHEAAGTARVLRLHGSLWELSCWDRCGQAPWPDRQAPLVQRPPRCPACGGLARPGVVWFGEALDGAVLEAAVEAVRGAALVLVVGTSSVVHPAAGLVDLAVDAGAYTVEVNPAATPASGRVDLVLAEPAEQALPRLDRAWRGGAA